MVEYIYDRPTASPTESLHWQQLEHHDGDRVIESLGEFNKVSVSNDSLALWSCLLGYCEALSTHKRDRYSLYPIPLQALERLVANEFTIPSIPAAAASPLSMPRNEQSGGELQVDHDQQQQQHRRAAQAISNWIWGKVVSKANAKDEKHANSLYTVLRGRIDTKSVDCFGAALCTVIGLRQLGAGFAGSTLTLSEDHAYESHCDDDNNHTFTCEVAVPGNTKAQKAKRGQETSTTFEKNSRLTPATSWLYMACCPVYCKTPHMILAAALANLNCLIDSASSSTREVNSEPLMLLKRELLWMLYDGGHLDTFPFALCELGWSEEHCTSPRGDERVVVPELAASLPVTRIEALYFQAIRCSQTKYQDKQVYPYCYMGFFHKDGGQDEEGRLAEATNYFSQAARVASGYLFDVRDTLQLTKVMTKLSEFIVAEILTKASSDRGDGGNSAGVVPRDWQDETNAIECGRHLLSFYDFLLAWEERSGEQNFVPICAPNHKTGIKSLGFLQRSFRQKAVERHGEFQSKRLQGSLGAAIVAPKVSISEMHVTIVSDSRRRRKRKASAS